MHFLQLQTLDTHTQTYMHKHTYMHTHTIQYVSFQTNSKNKYVQNTTSQAKILNRNKYTKLIIFRNKNNTTSSNFTDTSMLLAKIIPKQNRGIKRDMPDAVFSTNQPTESSILSRPKAFGGVWNLFGWGRGQEEIWFN